MEEKKKGDFKLKPSNIVILIVVQIMWRILKNNAKELSAQRKSSGM